MGAFDDVALVTIPATEEERIKWRWEPHEQVLLKGSIDVADREFINNVGSTTTKKTGVEAKMGTIQFALLCRMIKDWTFTRNGQKVPVNKHSIAQLPIQYSDRILAAIDRIAETMTEEEQEDFLDSANEHTSENFEWESLLQKKS